MEHKQENKNITFFGYLDMHYTHGSPHDADYDRDMQLPFKTIVNSGVASLPFCTLVPYFKLVPKIQPTENEKLFSTYSFNYSSNYLSTIWQPPKAC